MASKEIKIEGLCGHKGCQVCEVITFKKIMQVEFKCNKEECDIKTYHYHQKEL